MAFFTRPQSASAAVKIVAPSAVPGYSIKTSPKKDMSQQQCRNTLINGSCKLQDKGCVYVHPPRPTTSPSASVRPPPETPRVSTKLSLDADAPEFVPRSSTLPATFPPLSHAQAETSLTEGDTIFPDQRSVPAPQPEMRRVLTKPSLDVSATVFVPKSSSIPPTSPTSSALSCAQVRAPIKADVICTDRPSSSAPQPETSTVSTKLSLNIDAPVFVPKSTPSLPTSPALFRPQLQTSLSAGVIVSPPKTSKVSAKSYLDANAPAFVPKSSLIPPASSPLFGAQMKTPLMEGDICPNQRSAPAFQPESHRVSTKLSLDINAPVFVPKSSQLLHTSSAISCVQAQTSLTTGVICPDQHFESAPQPEPPRGFARISLDANAPVFVPRASSLPYASPPLSYAQAQTPNTAILSNTDNDKNDSYDPYHNSEYDQEVECDRQSSAFIRQPLDCLSDSLPPSPPPSYFLSDHVQELSRVDSRQRVESSSPTLEYVPTLTPDLKTPTSDLIHNPLTMGQECITVVNTSPFLTLTSPPVLANKLLSDYVKKSFTDNKQCIDATTTPSLSIQEHVPTSLPSHLSIQNPPDKLQLIVPVSRSCWSKDKDKLYSLIDGLQELISSASVEHRSQLSKQVTALHAIFKKQNEQLIELLQLSEECANRRLLYISAELKQQSFFLDILKGRLEVAEDLRGQAANLKSLYESKIVAIMRNLRAKVLSRPLQEDQALFSELDLVLTEITRCYVELDKFWIEEISRTSEALKMRRVDPTDFERWKQGWKDFHKDLKQTIESWKNEPSSGNAQTLRRNNARSLTEVDVRAIASSLSSAMGLLTSLLDRLPSSNSVKYSRSSQSFIQQVYQAFAANSELCLEFWEKVLAWCLPSIALPTSRCVCFPHDFLDRTTRLRSEWTHISAENTDSIRGSRKFKTAYDKALSLEKRSSSTLNALLEQLSFCVIAIDGCGLTSDALPDVITLEQLNEQWDKARHSVREALATLKNEPAPQSSCRPATSASAPRASTRPRSVMKRLMPNLRRFS